MSFDTHGYSVLRSLLSQEQQAALFEYALTEAPVVAVDPEVPGTLVAYGDPRMEHLLEMLRPRIERESGRSLFPTYSYFRRYKRGDKLSRHVDREACEVSLSLNLGRQSDQPWPLWLETYDKQARAIELEPGDAVVYRGIDLPHWREAFDGELTLQVFLHYVDQNGPYAGFKFDGRPTLGSPSVG